MNEIQNDHSNASAHHLTIAPSPTPSSSSTASLIINSQASNTSRNNLPSDVSLERNGAIGGHNQNNGNASSVNPNLDKTHLFAILQFLKKNNLTESEQILRKETQLLASLSDDEILGLSAISNETDGNNISNVLLTYKSEGDPDIYEDNYNNLKKFIESSLDSYRHELVMLLYPVFVHMYIELVYNDHEDQAIRLMTKFGTEQEYYYQEDIKKLAIVTKKEHLQANNELIDNFRSEQNLFTLRLSRDSYNYLKRYLQEKSKTNTSIVQNIIQEHLYLDVYEGITRTKVQVECSAGGMMGEAKREANKSKVFYGLCKEPEIKVPIPDDDVDDIGAGEGAAEGEKPKKKKVKKDTGQSKKVRTDPNAPPPNRIPLPELRDAEQKDKGKARIEAMKALKVGPETLPSICLYSIINAHYHHNMAALCAEISEDSTLLAAGFADSMVRVWALGPNKLKIMRSSAELELIDKETDDVLYRMMDDKTTFDTKVLNGHSGPVYGISMSPARDLLLSCSEDSTIRLWSLLTWTNICCYKGHVFPVWDVKFSPHTYYFASCAHDRTARLWATDQANPLRLFAGHISDVDCVVFHPNSNYIATGSTDRSVRLWDVLNGQCVRYLTGHKGTVYTLAFENTGRFLASAGADRRILLWDLAHGHLIAELSGHHDTTYTLCFSRGLEGAILASGGIDDCVNLWDIQGLIDDLDMEELNASHTPSIRTNTESFLLGSYRTKTTSILTTHFTRRNLLLSVGIVH